MGIEDWGLRIGDLGFGILLSGKPLGLALLRAVYCVLPTAHCLTESRATVSRAANSLTRFVTSAFDQRRGVVRLDAGVDD